MDALLKHKAFNAISVADLAREAQVSPATIYQRFSNVDATASVLLELYYLKVEEWAKRPRASKGDASLYDALLTIAADAYDQVSELGHIMRPAYLYSRQRPERVDPDWNRLEKIAIEGFKVFLREQPDDIRIDDVDEAAAVLCYLLNFLLLGPLLHGEDSNWTIVREREDFARTIATVAYRYLVPRQ